MSQSKKHSHYEAMANQAIGVAVGWLVVAYILIPLSKVWSAEEVATLSTIIFFVISYARIYIIRRFFNKIKV